MIDVLRLMLAVGQVILMIGAAWSFWRGHKASEKGDIDESRYRQLWGMIMVTLVAALN